MTRLLPQLIVLLLLTPPITAQSPYHINLGTDLPLAAVSLGVLGSSYILDGEPGSQTSENSINRLDRSLMRPYSGVLDDLGTISSCTALLLPAISIAGSLNSHDTLATYGVMYAEAFLLTTGIKDLMKTGTSRWRPYTYEQNFDSAGDDDYYNSFPSGHTAYAFLGATFLTATFAKEYPDSPWLIPLAAGSYSLAVGTGALRVASGEHFITDVAAGAAIGTLCGWIVPRLHEKQSGPDRGLAITPAAGGFIIHLEM